MVFRCIKLLFTLTTIFTHISRLQISKSRAYTTRRCGITSAHTRAVARARVAGTINYSYKMSTGNLSTVSCLLQVRRGAGTARGTRLPAAPRRGARARRAGGRARGTPGPRTPAPRPGRRRRRSGRRARPTRRRPGPTRARRTPRARAPTRRTPRGTTPRRRRRSRPCSSAAATLRPAI